MMSMLLTVVTIPLVKASEENAAATNFSVTPLNEKTLKPQSSYFDLKLSPGSNKKMTVRIDNPNDEAIKVLVEANNGSTNDNGITSYLTTKKRDTTLKVAFSDMTSFKKETITVPKNATKNVVVPINVPQESFEGVVLGGLRFSLEDDDKKKAETSTVTSKISYTIGVLLKESDEAIEPKMKLNAVQVEQRNARNYISANLQNTVPRIIKKLEVNARVYKESGKKVLYEGNATNLRMAPHSNFNYGINLDDQPLIAGKYRMEITGKADGVPFSFKRNFKIERKIATDFNKNAVYVEEKSALWLWLLISALVVVVVGLVIYLRRVKKGKVNKF